MGLPAGTRGDLRGGLRRGPSRRGLSRIQAQKRAQILDAALDAFSERGFNGASIDRIAERAGMSKPNVLYYFPARKRSIAPC